MTISVVSVFVHLKLPYDIISQQMTPVPVLSFNISSNHQLSYLKIAYKLYELEELGKKAAFARQRYYENGSKALKLLAWKLRKQQAESTVYT